MKIFVFDTETTGLPDDRYAPVIATHKWPYIVQLSYLLYDIEKDSVIKSIDKIIKLPKDIKITKESTNIHKITDEISSTRGVFLKDELLEFNNTLLEADLIIGHNIEFDKNMIMVECYRHKIINNFTAAGQKNNEFCTMKNSINLCKIIKYNSRGEPYYKYPKLMELHKHLFGTIPDGLHNSMIDILVCLRCYGMMKLEIDLFKCEGIIRILENNSFY